MRGVLVATLMVVMLAGCAAESAPPVEEVPAAFEDIQVTGNRGAIRGLVLSETITPIEGAEVKLTGTDQVKVSDEQGAFVFVDLDAGDYFLTVSKPGYFGVQASTTVVAGVPNPPIVKVQLLIDAANQPFTEVFHWAGFLECGVMWSSNTVPPPLSYAGANACGLHDGRFIETFPFGADRMPDFAQAEAVWEGTQPLSNRLTMGFYRGGTVDWKSVHGLSPLLLNATGEEIYNAFDENVTQLRMRMFPGEADEPASVVVTTNQGFDVYLTLFYGFVPRPDWTFVAEGNCANPSQCS